MMNDDKDRDQASLTGKPEIPARGDDTDALIDRCENDRASMSPKETADCAGATIVERYETDEDGGS